MTGRLRRLFLRRLLALPLLSLCVSLGVFALAALSPFDPLESYTRGNAGLLTPEQRAQLESQLGLDRSWLQSWWDWFSHLLTGQLGTSRYYGEAVSVVISQRLPWTFILGSWALGFAIVFSLVLGLWAGLHRGGVIDRAVGTFATLVQSSPPFVLALTGILVFAIFLRWVPAGGISDPGQPVSFAGVVRHAVLPATILGLAQSPWFILSLRASVKQALDDDALRGALSRGLPRNTIVFKHIAPAALPPFVALVGSTLPELIVGSTIIETMFSWPGVGQALVASAKALDFSLLATLVFFVTIAVLIGNMLADAVIVASDPRVDANV